MSALRRRVLALDRQVRWLETEGALIGIELRFKILEKKQEIADRLAADPETAAMWKAAGCMDDLPPPRVTPRLPPPPPEAESPHPEELREARRLEGCATNKVLAHTLRDATLRAAPQGEVVCRPPSPEPPQKPPPEPPVEAPMQPVVEPYVPIQRGLVRWRHREATDYHDDDDDDDVPQCLTDYDPFADE